MHMFMLAAVQFHDGVYLVLLMGLLEGYFVPLYHFHLTPTTNEQKVTLSLLVMAVHFICVHMCVCFASDTSCLTMCTFYIYCQFFTLDTIRF